MLSTEWVLLYSCALSLSSKPKSNERYNDWTLSYHFGIGALGNNLLIMILQLFPTAKPSCVFYYHLVPSVLMLITLVVYVIIAKRYKLREREENTLAYKP